MKVSYLSQGGAGRHIAEARVLKRGRQINFAEATLTREDGKLIATASATIMIAPMKKKAMNRPSASCGRAMGQKLSSVVKKLRQKATIP